MKLEITNTDNSAFAENKSAEVARILRAVADQIEAGTLEGMCRDINGNTVGDWGAADLEPEEEDRSDEGEEISGTYGSGKTPCTIFVFDGWYAVEGSRNVNQIGAIDEDKLVDGVDVEELADVNYFYWPNEIDSINELIRAVEA